MTKKTWKKTLNSEVLGEKKDKLETDIMLERSSSPFKMDKELSTDVTDSSDHTLGYETPLSQHSETKEHKPKKKSALVELLEQASKYQPQYEYSFPSSFLRKRKPPTRESETEEQVVVKKKAKSVPVKTDIDKVAVVENGKKKDTKIKTKKRSKKQKLKEDQKEATESPEPHLDIRVEDNKREQTGERPNTFVNWDLPSYSPPHKIFDIEYLKNNSSYTGEIVSSSFLTHFHNEMNSKNKNVSVSSKTIQVRNVLFPNFTEEFVFDFEMENFRYEPLAELGKFIEYAVNIYVPEKYKTAMQEEVIIPFNKAYDTKNTALLSTAVEKYNHYLETIPREEIISNLENVSEIPKSFLHDILQLVYTRSIHPHARKLKQYKAFSNYVYGELLPSFLSKVYTQCGLSPEHVFMDLGSGVGNCVIQASLEFGCKLSFGCEIMEAASDMTEVQMKELHNRCKLWGLNLSPVEYSLRESFVGNPRVLELVKQCDVLLINNFLFDANLNTAVTKLIQHTKPGCKIITLKNLRSFGYSLDAFNLDNILNKIKVERFDLENNSVSWTHNGGEYYISTVLDKIDETLLDPDLKNRRNTSRPVKYTR